MISKLGMTRKDNVCSNLSISMISPLVVLEHTSDIREELRTKKREQMEINGPGLGIERAYAIAV